MKKPVLVLIHGGRVVNYAQMDKPNQKAKTVAEEARVNTSLSVASANGQDFLNDYYQPCGY